jgi:hypothetical protein
MSSPNYPHMKRGEELRATIYEALTPAETKEHTEEYALYLLGLECNRVADNLEKLTEADYNKLRAAIYSREVELYGEGVDPC